MKKLKDIRQNLPPEIPLASQYSMGEAATIEENQDKKTLESFTQEGDVSIPTRTDIHIEKNRTKNFDALGPKTFKFPATIDITKKGFRKFFTRFHNTPMSRFYMVLGFCAIILVLFVDALIVENRVNSGYGKLVSLGQEKGDLKHVKHTINDARFDFLLSDILFTPFKLFSTEKITTGYHAIKGGKMLTKSLDNSLELYEKTLDFLEKKDIGEVYFTQLFENIHPQFLQLEDSLRAALYHYQSIENIPDPKIQAMLDTESKNLSFLVSKIAGINDNFSAFLDIFGHSKRKTYLVVFQNSDEIRPTGGFMGSMALVSVFRGQIKKFEPRDVYSFEWDLKRSDYQRVSPPKGIDTLTSSFGLRDANYYINLKDSSEAIKFFVEKSGQEIDGVIYINQNILLDFLEITGDISFDLIGKSISSTNFSEIMSLLVESKIYKEGTQGTPKQVLFDFIEVFKGELLNQKKYPQYIKTLIRHVESRDIMMYSFTKGENKLLQELGVNGVIDYDKTLDFSYPVFTSLSGNKSDRYMKRSFKKTIKPADACQIETELSIVSRHDFSSETSTYIDGLIEEFGVNTPNIKSIQGAGDNYQFVRIILPNDANIQPQAGMDILDYGERKGVEFFMRTRPRETTDYTVSYSLENPECDTYSYAHYKQPGIAKYDIQITSPEKQDLFIGLQQDFFYSKR